MPPFSSLFDRHFDVPDNIDRKHTGKVTYGKDKYARIRIFCEAFKKPVSKKRMGRPGSAHPLLRDDCFIHFLLSVSLSEAASVTASVSVSSSKAPSAALSAFI